MNFHVKQHFVNTYMQYYTIIDFNEVDIRIYQPEKVIFTEAAFAHIGEMNK